MSICKKCGLPQELCVCGTMAKEASKIRVSTDRRRFRKMVTIIEGIGEDANPKQVAKTLKSKLAAGGTYKNNLIIIQGDHKNKIKQLLVDIGFNEDQIEVF